MTISGDKFGTEQSSLPSLWNGRLAGCPRRNVQSPAPGLRLSFKRHARSCNRVQEASKLGGRPAEFRRAPLKSRQPACKPGSVWPVGEPTDVTAIPLGRRSPGASSNQPGRPDPDKIPAPMLAHDSRTAPIRFCSRWGLPCRRRCRRRGALLPHRFTLTAPARRRKRRSVLCGTVPGFAPAGRYPAPLVHGARTFLPGNLSVLPERPSSRLTCA